MTINYINNKDLFEELKTYRVMYLVSVQTGTERPHIPDPIAWAIMRISNKLMNSFRFVNYTYKEEMIGDAILKCCAKIHLFDPDKSENPFAYITQIAWNAAINRIKFEQNQSSVKARIIRETLSSEFTDHGIEDEDTQNSFVTFLKENDVYVDYNAERARKAAELHPSLTHRNKTKQVKKEEIEEEVFDLTQFEDIINE